MLNLIWIVSRIVKLVIHILASKQETVTAVYILRIDYFKVIMHWLIIWTPNTPKVELLRETPGFLDSPWLTTSQIIEEWGYKGSRASLRYVQQEGLTKKKRMLTHIQRSRLAGRLHKGENSSRRSFLSGSRPLKWGLSRGAWICPFWLHRGIAFMVLLWLSRSFL